MESTLIRTWSEIDLDALIHNYRTLRAHVGAGVRFLGVVKADAYGHGAVVVARTLQEEGFIDHKAYGPTYQYFAKVTREEYKQRSLIGLIDKYFDNSYLSAVSALVKEEKISVEELKELIDMIEKQ